MPLNIIIGLFALLIALILYSMGAWGAFRKKAVTWRHVTYLWVGFAFDVLATGMMAIAAGGLDLSPLPDLMHTIVAFVGMFGFLALALVATMALRAANEERLASLAKLALVPWVIWVFVFVWGMVSRGSQRMG